MISLQSHQKKEFFSFTMAFSIFFLSCVVTAQSWDLALATFCDYYSYVAYCTYLAVDWLAKMAGLSPTVDRRRINRFQKVPDGNNFYVPSVMHLMDEKHLAYKFVPYIFKKLFHK
jgi:hypothetical protein